MEGDGEECGALEQRLMLQSAADHRLPDKIFEGRRLAEHLRGGAPVQVFVWATLRPNTSKLHRFVSHDEEARPDHVCMTLVARNGWRYSFGYMYRGAGRRFPQALPQALPRALRPLLHYADSYEAKLVTPDWALEEALRNAVRRRRGEPVDPSKACGVRFLAAGFLSTRARVFLARLVGTSVVESNRTGGLDIFNERLLRQYRALVFCTSSDPRHHNCASFAARLLPELITCRHSPSSLVLPFACRSAAAPGAPPVRCRSEGDWARMLTEDGDDLDEEPARKRRRLQ